MKQILHAVQIEHRGRYESLNANFEDSADAIRSLQEGRVDAEYSLDRSDVGDLQRDLASGEAMILDFDTSTLNWANKYDAFVTVGEVWYYLVKWKE